MNSSRLSVCSVSVIALIDERVAKGGGKPKRGAKKKTEGPAAGAEKSQAPAGEKGHKGKQQQ